MPTKGGGRSSSMIKGDGGLISMLANSGFCIDISISLPTSDISDRILEVPSEFSKPVEAPTELLDQYWLREGWKLNEGSAELSAISG